MLSLDQCREILGTEAPADERQLEQMREQAYRMARVIIDMYVDQARSSGTSSSTSADKEVQGPEVPVP